MLRQLAGDRWIHAVAPEGADREALAARGVSSHWLRHATDPHELARVDHENGATLLIARVPQATPDGHRSATLGIVMQGDRMVTIATGELQVIQEIAGKQGIDEASPFRIFLELLHASASSFVTRVNDVNDDVERLEARLTRSMRNEAVLGLLDHQKTLVHLERALASNQIMLERLKNDPKCKFSKEEGELLEDALVEFQQAIQMTKISAEILSGMMDAFASIISNNLNVVMKVLSSLTILVALPAMVGTFWGMNVPVPLEDEPWAFWAIIGGILVVCGAVAMIFRGKRWL